MITPSAKVFWSLAAVYTRGGAEEQHFTKPEPVLCVAYWRHTNTTHGLSEKNFNRNMRDYFPLKQQLFFLEAHIGVLLHWLTCVSQHSQTLVEQNNTVTILHSFTLNTVPTQKS